MIYYVPNLPDNPVQLHYPKILNWLKAGTGTPLILHNTKPLPHSFRDQGFAVVTLKSDVDLKKKPIGRIVALCPTINLLEKRGYLIDNAPWESVVVGLELEGPEREALEAWLAQREFQTVNWKRPS